MFAEYLPAPVLSVGLLNFIEEPLEEPLVRKLEKLTLDLTQQLQRDLAKVISGNARYFAPISPIVRIISIAPDTSGRECSLAPRSGIESFHIIPYPPKTVTPQATTTNKNRAQQETGDARLYLPGNPGAPENANRRATIVLVSNSELLIVICNESALPNVGSAADAIFQAAISYAIPTIVINPQSPDTLFILTSNDLHADSGLALPDRQFQPLGGDLTDLVSQMIAPPAKRSKRAGLEDFLQSPITHSLGVSNIRCCSDFLLEITIQHGQLRLLKYFLTQQTKRAFQKRVRCSTVHERYSMNWRSAMETCLDQVLSGNTSRC